MDLMTVALGWFAPLLIVAYVLWLLTRLTQTVERIEWHLKQIGSADRPARLE